MENENKEKLSPSFLGPKDIEYTEEAVPRKSPEDLNKINDLDTRLRFALKEVVRSKKQGEDVENSEYARIAAETLQEINRKVDIEIEAGRTKSAADVTNLKDGQDKKTA